MQYQSQYPYSYPYGQYQTPAYQPQTFLPQQQQAQQRVVGRVIGSAQEVTPQEVPMDGSLALFLLADGSAVVGKRWTPEGTIDEVRFVKETTEPQASTPTFEESVLDRLDAIEDNLASIMTPAQQPKRTTRRAKEAVDES